MGTRTLSHNENDSPRLQSNQSATRISPTKSRLAALRSGGSVSMERSLSSPSYHGPGQSPSSSPSKFRRTLPPKHISIPPPPSTEMNLNSGPATAPIFSQQHFSPSLFDDFQSPWESVDPSVLTDFTISPSKKRAADLDEPDHSLNALHPIPSPGLRQRRRQDVVGVDFVIGKSGTAELVRQRFPGVDDDGLRAMQRSASWAGDPAIDNHRSPMSPTNPKSSDIENNNETEFGHKRPLSGLMAQVLEQSADSPSRSASIGSPTDKALPNTHESRLSLTKSSKVPSASLVATTKGAAMVRSLSTKTHEAESSIEKTPTQDTAQDTLPDQESKDEDDPDERLLGNILPNRNPSRSQKSLLSPCTTYESEGSDSESNGSLLEQRELHSYDDDLDARAAIKKAIDRKNSVNPLFNNEQIGPIGSDPALMSSPLDDTSGRKTPPRNEKRPQCDACKMIFRNRNALKDHEKSCSVKQTPFLSSDFFNDEDFVRESWGYQPKHIDNSVYDEFSVNDHSMPDLPSSPPVPSPLANEASNALQSALISPPSRRPAPESEPQPSANALGRGFRSAEKPTVGRPGVASGSRSRDRRNINALGLESPRQIRSSTRVSKPNHNTNALASSDNGLASPETPTRFTT